MCYFQLCSFLLALYDEIFALSINIEYLRAMMQQNCIFREYIMQYSLSIWAQVNVPDSCSRLYGPRCGGCGEGISPSDLIRKAKDKVFHVKCFLCQVRWSENSNAKSYIVIYIAGLQETVVNRWRALHTRQRQVPMQRWLLQSQKQSRCIIFLSDSYTNYLYSWQIVKLV